MSGSCPMARPTVRIAGGSPGGTKEIGGGFVGPRLASGPEPPPGWTLARLWSRANAGQMENKTRNVLLVLGLLLAACSILVLASLEEVPTIACSAADLPVKKNRNTREVWGPTDANAQMGNQRLLVATNEKGTVTVFKYPTPSYADQIKHHAVDRRAPYYGSDPNAGAFLGLVVTMSDGSRQFDWLRDWGPVSTSDPEYGDHVGQTWRSGVSDVLVTEFRNDTLGLGVRVTNVVPKDRDVFVRDVTVAADANSPVRDVTLVSYENFNLVEDKDALIPTQDWCSENENGEVATYDPTTDAVVHASPDKDHAWFGQDGEEFSIATAMAFGEPSSQHQVVGDAHRGDHANDPYELLSNGTIDLPGDDRFRGQTSAVLTRDLDFEDGHGSARVYFSAASAPTPNKDLGGEAARKIEAARGRPLQQAIQEKEDWFRQYVGDAPLPVGAPENVVRVSRRALVSVVQIWDDETENEHGFSGNLVASITTQGPYGADWIRDGAYFNYVLDRYVGEGGDGLPDWVAQHNRWYMSLQQNPGDPCPEHCHDNMKYYDIAGLVPQIGPFPEWFARVVPTASVVPRGGWAMNYYADGQPAGPLGGEIDETAYGAWTLWDHYAVTENEDYLRRVYPAIKLVGDYLTEDCVDETTGLQCPRPEDDNFEHTQTIVGGASVYAGLSSAVKAAAEMHRITGERRYAEQALGYARRRDEAGRAIEQHYWNEEKGFYGARSGVPSPRVAMPSFLRPVDNPKMEAHLQSMWDHVSPTFQNERDYGQYEAKSLIGLGIAARESEDPPVGLNAVREGVTWIADEHARSNSTFVMGEAWVRETYADGEVDSAVSQPHVWEQLLFYVSALIAYDDSSGTAYDEMANDVYATWSRHDATITTLEVESRGGPYTRDDTVQAAATVVNEATVPQAYHVKYEIEGPDGTSHTGTQTDVGPIPAGGTERVPLRWSVGTETEVASGRHDVRVSVWRSAATGDDDTVDPEDVAARPTALAAEQYRRVELDVVTMDNAVGVRGSADSV